jgi:hypothetical protein
MNHSFVESPEMKNVYDGSRAHPVVVEEPKIDDERGHYLNPELFGQPEDHSIMATRYPNVRRRQT